MTITDWLWILHPALAVVLIYPLIGMVVRLAWQTRQRRVAQVKHPPMVGRDHSDLGRWLAAGVVLLVLIALTVVIATKAPPADFSGGAGRAIQLSIVLLGTGASLVALLAKQGCRPAPQLQLDHLDWCAHAGSPAGGLASVG